MIDKHLPLYCKRCPFLQRQSTPGKEIIFDNLGLLYGLKWREQKRGVAANERD